MNKIFLFISILNKCNELLSLISFFPPALSSYSPKPLSYTATLKLITFFSFIIFGTYVFVCTDIKKINILSLLLLLVVYDFKIEHVLLKKQKKMSLPWER